MTLIPQMMKQIIRLIMQGHVGRHNKSAHRAPESLGNPQLGGAGGAGQGGAGGMDEAGGISRRGLVLATTEALRMCAHLKECMAVLARPVQSRVWRSR
jgi:hypothetical protein